MKKPIAIMLSMLILLGIAGCSSNAPGQTTAPTGKVTLKFVRIGNDQAEADYWKGMIAR